ncbi:hypothetical protein BJ742DRAFT_797818 [Cladochytrium replicatum]|nr:hypothetical protein BJ742DRAFT_797818 [Cladochytrium replicatum]
MSKNNSFGWSPERTEFASSWHSTKDHFWEQKLGYICTKDELIREDMIGYYRTLVKPRLLLDTVTREIIRGDSLGKIKYLAISHAWRKVDIEGIVLNGMYWQQDQIDKDALNCLINDAWSLGFRYAWIDALCTPQIEDFDIEDINRMREYFSECASCLVYLNGIGVDVTTQDIATGNLNWFSRYWTLQEGWLPYQCLFKLTLDNQIVFATDYNFYWLLAASPCLGENQALQQGFEVLGRSWWPTPPNMDRGEPELANVPELPNVDRWWPTLANVDRQLSGRSGFLLVDAIYAILHLVRPYFINPNVSAPYETDVETLARWFVAQLKDPSHLVSCPTILSLFGDSKEYAWLRRAPPLPISISEAEDIKYYVKWPSDPSEPLGLQRSREYPTHSPPLRDSSKLWDYRAARAVQFAMVRKSGGGNLLNNGMWKKLEKFQEAGCPDGHIVEAIMDGAVPERLALVSTHKRWPEDPMYVVRELVLVRGSVDEAGVHHCVGWRESILDSVPQYRMQDILVVEAEIDEASFRYGEPWVMSIGNLFSVNLD